MGILGRITKTALDTGLTVAGRAVGLAKGTVRVVTGHGSERTPDTPTPADVADNIAPVPADPAPDRPPTADELAAGAGPDLTTPVGTSAADQGYNPHTAETDLQQPGTEPLMDPATTKAVASEAEMLGEAADPDKG